MKRRRQHISQRTMKVAALREYAMTLRVERDGELVPALTYEQAKGMTEEQIEELWHWDHIVPHAIGGSCEHHNLQPMLKKDHALKTAKKDIPQIAKTKRIADAYAQQRSRILAKSGQPTVDSCSESVNKARPRVKGGGWPKGRKLQARPFRSGAK